MRIALSLSRGSLSHCYETRLCLVALQLQLDTAVMQYHELEASEPTDHR